MAVTLSNQTNLSIWGGMSPEWLPPQGQYGRIPMTNTLRSIEEPVPPGYDPSWWYGPFPAVLTEYSGAAFSEDYSALGALCCHGGGDGGHWGNGIYIADLTSLQWSVAVPSSPAGLAVNWSDHMARARTDKGRNLVADGTPAIGVHVYSSCETIPQSWNVGAPSYVRPQLPCSNYEMFGMAASLFGGPWRDFQQENAVSWNGSSTVPMSTRDDNRECFYVAPAWGSGGSSYYRITKTGVVTQIPGSFGVGGIVVSMSYCPTLDLLIALQGDGVFSLRYPDVVGSPAFPGATGTPPTYGAAPPSAGNGPHPEWDPDRNCFVLWDHAAERIYKLHPPTGDPMTMPWVWTNELIAKALAPYTPTTTPQNYPGGQWSKLRRVPELRAFVYPWPDELLIIRPYD